MHFLMCRPDFYGIFYEINPWMHVRHQADVQLAQQQWQTLYSVMTELGARIDLLPPVAGLPDMVFTANAGLFYRNQIVLPHFRYAERRGEVEHAKQWFKQNGFHFHHQMNNDPSFFFEGAGDALWNGERLFAAYGFRSERRFYEQSDVFSAQHLVWCELQDSYFYHLDTCFCPLNSELAMWYPPAFTEESQQRMMDATRCIAVSPEEAKRFACNAIVIDQTVIIPDGCPRLAAQLQAEGFTAHEVAMSEFIKAGGACKCLSLRID